MLERQIDDLVQQILLKAENQHELLLGTCQSGVKLTNTQEHILMLLSEDKLTNTDLARILKLSQAAVTKAVKLLVKEGLVAAVKGVEDARMTYFVLTDAAKPIAQEHKSHHNSTLSVYASLLEEFSQEEQAVLGRFIQAFSQTLES